MVSDNNVSHILVLPCEPYSYSNEPRIILYFQRLGAPSTVWTKIDADQLHAACSAIIDRGVLQSSENGITSKDVQAHIKEGGMAFCYLTQKYTTNSTVGKVRGIVRTLIRQKTKVPH